MSAQTDPADTRRAGLLLTLLVSLPWLTELAGFFLDSRTVVSTFDGGTAAVAGSAYSGLIRYALAGTVLVGLWLELVRSRQINAFTLIHPLALAGYWVTISILLRGEGLRAALPALVFCVLLLLSGGLRLERDTLRYAARSVIVLLGILVLSAAAPSVSWSSCRSDKCTAFGGLFRGFFLHENILGLLLTVMVPLLAWLTSTAWFGASLTVSFLFVYATGSRTALVACVVSIAIALFIRAALSTPGLDPQRETPLAAATRMLIAVGGVLILVTSSVLMVVLPDDAFTRRGIIFRLVRESTAALPWTGAGPAALADTYQRSEIEWVPEHAHAQAAYLLNEGGIPALALFGFGLLLVALLPVGRQAGLLVIAGAPALLAFVTEPVWDYSINSLYVASFLLFITSATRVAGHSPAAGSPPPTTGPSGRPEGEERVTSWS